MNLRRLWFVPTSSPGSDQTWQLTQIQTLANSDYLMAADLPLIGTEFGPNVNIVPNSQHLVLTWYKTMASLR